MNANRTIVASLVLAVTALAPAAALARQGADDNPNVPDDKGGQRAGDDGARRADDRGDDNGAQRDRARGRRGHRAVVRVAGSCTAGSTAKLEVKREDRGLKAEFEVDQNVAGVMWNVTLARNGATAFTTTATTHAPSGSFSVERRLRDGAGSDAISATATSPSGETCTASAMI